MNLGWLLSLFFVGLLSSQSLIDLFAGLISLTVIYKVFRQQVRLPKFGIEKFLMAWALVILTGLLINMGPDVPWIKNFLEFRWMLELYFFAAALSLVDPREKDFDKLLYPLLFASLFAVVICFLSFIPTIGAWANSYKFVSDHRAGGLLSNPMPLAHSYGMLTLVLMGPILLYTKNDFRKNKLWLASTLVTGLAVFLTFTRGVWIGLAVGLVAMAFLINWKMGLKILGSVVLAFILLFTVVTPFRERVLFSFNPEKTYDSERIIIWKTNLLIFKENPLLGIGYSENSRRIREYYNKSGVPADFKLESHAHNQYIHFLAGTGILGLLAYLVMIFLMYRIHNGVFVYFQKKQERFWAGLALGIIGAETCFYIAGFTESNFSIAKNRYLLILLWSLGCWLALKSKLRFK